jgi:hypothetical protein
MIGGNIDIDNQANLSAPDGQVNLASTQSTGEIAAALEQTDTEQFDNLGSIIVTNNSAVDASGLGGGRVVIRGGELVVDSSTVSADTEAYALQINPNIDIKTSEQITVDNGAIISADLKMFADGTLSGIEIDTENLTVANYSSIQSLADFLSFGNAGSINADIKNINLDNYSMLSTSSSSTGNSGSISINNAETLNITNASSIKTSANPFLGEGASGNIYVDAALIEFTGLENPLNPELLDFTGIDAGNSIINGNISGNITITTRNLKLSNQSQIRTITGGDFKSGNINIESTNLTIESGAQIKSQSTMGESGYIKINNQNRVMVTGSSENPNPLTNNYNSSSILTDGGGLSQINISSNEILVLDGAKIITQNNFSPSGSSGNISLNANLIEISGLNRTIFDHLIRNGMTSDNAEMFARSQIKSSTLVDNSQTDTNSSAGSITINADRFLVNKNASIEASSVSESGDTLTGDSGNIEINANYISLDTARLLTSASNANGGNIFARSNGYFVIKESTISSSVESNNGNGGNLALTSGIMAIENSRLTAAANAGNGGNISVNSNALFLSETNFFDASSQVALDGQISINSKIKIEKMFRKLPTQIMDVTKLFSSTCKGDSKLSSLRSRIDLHNTSRTIDFRQSHHKIDTSALSTSLEKQIDFSYISNKYENKPELLAHGENCF